MIHLGLRTNKIKIMYDIEIKEEEWEFLNNINKNKKNEKN